MTSLESLVPPLDLCKRIPAGAFADSALVRWGACVYPRLHIDGTRCGEPYRRPGALPAPTLQEIMAALARMEVCPGMDMLVNINGEICGSVVARMQNVNFCGKSTPAEAALKLWLELNKEKKK